MAQDANELRKIAESADGTRDKDVYLTIEGGELRRSTSRPGNVPAITVKTAWHGGGLHGNQSLSVTGGGTIPPEADAAFTSQSAFEKFVLPYYIRTRTPDELNAMMNKAYADDIICAFHEPDSDTGTTSGGKGLGLVKADGKIEFI